MLLEEKDSEENEQDGLREKTKLINFVFEKGCELTGKKVIHRDEGTNMFADVRCRTLLMVLRISRFMAWL